MTSQPLQRLMPKEDGHICECTKEREQEWKEAVQWLREEVCSCGIGSGRGDCYTCKAINKAFGGGIKDE